MKLAELIDYYSEKTLPKPARSTLLALRRLEQVERCRFVVQYKGVTVAAFISLGFANDFAAKGRRDTPGDDPIVVVDLAAGAVP